MKYIRLFSITFCSAILGKVLLSYVQHSAHSDAACLMMVGGCLGLAFTCSYLVEKL